MRPSRTWLAITFAFTSALAAEETALYTALSLLPNCALSCITHEVARSPCQLTDLKCICTNSSLLHQVEICVLTSCTIQESLLTKNITSKSCGAPVRNKSETTRLRNIIQSVITAIIGLIRLTYNAIFFPVGWGWDDYSLLAVLIAGAPSVVIIDRMSIPNGLGQDVWNVPLEKIIAFVRSIYALEILYFLQIVLVKAAILLFFLKIFPKHTTRRLIKFTFVFNALYGFIFTTIAIFPCQPINHYWTRFEGTTRGKCIDINGLVWANAGISIALDVWMLAVPLYEVFRLQMSWLKRCSVALMFFVGTFVTIVSMVRLRYLVTFAKGNNPTWDQSDVVDWSNIEINVGILCACMPTLRAMLARVYPRLLSSTKQNSGPLDDLSQEKSAKDSRKERSMDSDFGLTEHDSGKDLELHRFASRI